MSSPVSTPSTSTSRGADTSASAAEEKNAPPGVRVKEGSETAAPGREGSSDDFDAVFDRPPRRRATEQSAGAGSTGSRQMPLSRRRKIAREPTWRESFMAIVKASWLNVLLIFIPAGWAVHFAHVDATVVFVLNFIAIIPLAKLLGYGTEEIALRVGQTLGGLLNATLGNAVELIVAIIALVKCQIRVVQASLAGSILSNILLVLGCVFFAGGIKYSEQGFKESASQLNSSLLVMAVIALLIPAGYNATFGDTQDSAAERDAILQMSRGGSIILLFIYGGYLLFQLFTHPHLYADVAGVADDEAAVGQGRRVRGLGERRIMRNARSARRPRLAVAEAGGEGYEIEEEEEEVPALSLWAALILLVVVTVIIGFTAEFLLDGLQGLTDAHPEVSQEWVGLILLPIVGNAAEHVTAVSVAVHDKLDLSLGVAVGSSIQISLFVIPFMVVLAWIIDKPLSLLFDPFESITLFLSVLLANYTMQDSRSNWLEGWILILTYILIAVAFWYVPSSASEASSLFQCS